MDLEKVIAEIQKEADSARFMHDKIQMDPKRKIDQPCEKLHYWDGKATGLATAIYVLRKHQRRSR